MDAVQEKGSFIFLQLGALGRRAIPDALKAIDPSWDVVSPGNIPVKDGPIPRAMTRDEIREHVDFFRSTALNAIEKIGFDGVKLHGGNGFLLDQFLQDVSNN